MTTTEANGPSTFEDALAASIQDPWASVNAVADSVNGMVENLAIPFQQMASDIKVLATMSELQNNVKWKELVGLRLELC